MDAYVVVKDGITASVEELARQYPLFYRRAVADLGRRWRRRIAQEWKAGVPGGSTLVPLADVTGILKAQRQSGQRKKLDVWKSGRRRRLREIKTQLLTGRAAEYGTFDQRIKRLRSNIETLEGHGGKLPGAVSWEVRGQTLNVGMLQGVGLEAWGESYQEGKTRPMRREERAMFYRRLGTKNIPRVYRKPERSVISPFGTEWSQDAQDTVRKSLLAQIENAQSKKINNFLTPKVGTL